MTEASEYSDPDLSEANSADNPIVGFAALPLMTSEVEIGALELTFSRRDGTLCKLTAPRAVCEGLRAIIGDLDEIDWSLGDRFIAGARPN